MAVRRWADSSVDVDHLARVVDRTEKHSPGLDFSSSDATPPPRLSPHLVQSRGRNPDLVPTAIGVSRYGVRLPNTTFDAWQVEALPPHCGSRHGRIFGVTEESKAVI